MRWGADIGSGARRLLLKASVVGACLALAGTIAGTARAEDLKVVATIKPIHALVAGVMTGVGTPELLVAGAASPHTFALKPSGARALHAAAVVFRVSPAVEPFTVKIAASLPATVRMSTLAEAPGVQHLAMRHGATFHDHGHGDEEHPADGAMDGHVWLDPQNAKAMVAEIARVLSEAAPDAAATFAANAQRLTAEIDALDAEIDAALNPVRDKPYVVFHDAYQYFDHRYRLSPVGALTIAPDVQPGAKRISEIRAEIAKVGAVCVFAEPQFPAKVMRAVTDGTEARFGTLDPEGALVAPGAAAYGTLMRNLAESLRGCLAPQPASSAAN